MSPTQFLRTRLSIISLAAASGALMSAAMSPAAAPAQPVAAAAPAATPPVSDAQALRAWFGPRANVSELRDRVCGAGTKPKRSRRHAHRARGEIGEH